MPNEKITLYFQKFYQAINDLPAIVGAEVVNYSLEAFEKQGWNGTPWAARKSKKDAARALLIKSGRLRRSIQVIRTTQSSVVVGSDVPYAEIQNNGGIINTRARTETFVRPRYLKGDKKGAFRKLTKADRSAAPTKGQAYKAGSSTRIGRPFIGYTPELGQRIKAAALKRLKEVNTIS